MRKQKEPAAVTGRSIPDIVQIPKRYPEIVEQLGGNAWIVSDRWSAGEKAGQPFVMLVMENTQLAYNGAVFTIHPERGPEFELDPKERTLTVVHRSPDAQRVCRHTVTLACHLEAAEEVAS